MLSTADSLTLDENQTGEEKEEKNVARGERGEEKKHFMTGEGGVRGSWEEEERRAFARGKPQPAFRALKDRLRGSPYFLPFLHAVSFLLTENCVQSVLSDEI